MNCLIVLLGPTGVGKTDLSLELAEHFGSPIISADSRQIYKDMQIGTAAPTFAQRMRVPHFFVGSLPINCYFSASQFENDAVTVIEQQLKRIPAVIMSGGSMMYIDAVCNGIDEMPTVTAEIRDEVYDEYARAGLAPFLAELQQADPVHYEEVDHCNYKRVLHAVEMCRMTGKPYSSFRTRKKKQRPFQIIKIGLTRDREELYERINSRVDEMMAAGLLEEAKRLYAFRHLNALNTVGYKELFQYMEGKWTIETAVEKIKRNTRVYARKQMTWFKRDKEIHWFSPDDKTLIIDFIEKEMNRPADPSIS